jgi:hypothetical protein
MRSPAILTEIFRGISQYLQGNLSILGLLSIIARPCPSTSLLVIHSVTILSFDPVALLFSKKGLSQLLLLLICINTSP